MPDPIASLSQSVHEPAIELQENGYALFCGIVTSASVNELIRAIEGRIGHRSSRRGEDYAARNLLRDVPEIRDLATSGDLMPIARALLGENAFPVRGILFDKPSAANWHVGWHQDTMIAVAERQDVPGFGPWSVKAGVVHVKPPAEILASMLALRLHLDNCGAENGPLRVLPGSHRHGFLSSDGIANWIATRESFSCFASGGDVLAMRPLLLHASSRAESASHRRVIHIEYASQPLPGPLRWAVA